MSRTRYIAQAGVIAAVYCTLTLLTMQFLQGLGVGSRPAAGERGVHRHRDVHARGACRA